MKKIATLFIVVFVTALVLSACNQKECPAYSKADTEQASGNV